MNQSKSKAHTMQTGSDSKNPFHGPEFLSLLSTTSDFTNVIKNVDMEESQIGLKLSSASHSKFHPKPNQIASHDAAKNFPLENLTKLVGS